ncbi:Amino acid permease family protein [Brugia pahangi]
MVAIQKIDINMEAEKKQILFTLFDPICTSNKQDDDEQAIPDYSSLHNESEMTIERIPSIENYRLPLYSRKNSNLPSRATQLEMQNVQGSMHHHINAIQSDNSEFSSSKSKKNFFQVNTSGVFIPVFTNIVGSLLYLRNSWIAGQAGLLGGIAIVLLSALVCIVTALSISGICSNGECKKGGLYYVISRSLGPEFGGSIGAIFSIANAMMASLYVVSAAETIVDLMNENGFSTLTNSKINDVRLFGVVICLILMLITFAGPKIEDTATLFMFSLYHLSFLDWCFGSLLLSPNDEQKLRGMTGYNIATISENLYPAWRDENFISVYAVFFPGMTGLMAGSMFINELKDQAYDVPVGMFSAIGVCILYNLICIFIPAATMLRDVPGDIIPEFNNVTFNWEPFPCAMNHTCNYGLMNFFQVAKLESAWSPLLIAGIFAMSLSSTMTNLDNGPQIFQAMCKDELFPLFRYFSKEYDLNIPQRAYILFSILTIAVILIGDLNIINGFVSNLFLAAYASVNYACFDASFAKSPGFRPSFRFYNMWLSLVGASICIIVMFIISWSFALLIFAFFFMIFVYLSKRHLDVNWGPSTAAVRYRIALNILLKLSNDVEHTKNYRPQILLIIGNPIFRPSLLHFASYITKGESLLIAGHIIQHERNEYTFHLIHQLDKEITDWFNSNKLKAFYLPFLNCNMRIGAQCLLQLAGIGRLRPNIVMLGFRNKWFENGKDGLSEIENYVGIIRDAFENNFAVGILSNSTNGFDIREMRADLNLTNISSIKSPSFKQHSYHPMKKLCNELGKRKLSHNLCSIPSRLSSVCYSVGNSADISTNQEKVNIFHQRIRKGRIDVWWLYDDGGLTLLIPHLLRLPKSYLEDAELYIFTFTTCAKTDEKKLASLLSKFRIPFTDVRVITDITSEPRPVMLNHFEAIIASMRVTENDKRNGLISDCELAAQKMRTNRQLYIRELLQHHSRQADLIVITLPVPRLEISSSLYMAWLDLITRDLPPVLMIRGNQTPVLTFYA